MEARLIKRGKCDECGGRAAVALALAGAKVSGRLCVDCVDRLLIDVETLLAVGRMGVPKGVTPPS